MFYARGQALTRNANRTLAVLGYARAARAIGDTQTALAQYRVLTANYARADAGLPEANEARAAVSGKTPR